MADRMGNLLDEMDQRRKIVEKKMGWSLDPVDWFLNSDQIIQLVLERFPELLQELSFPPSPSPSSDKQIYAPPPISEPPPIITIKVIQTSPVIQTPPMTYNPPQSPVISPPPTITTIPQTQTDLQTPHNSNRSSLPFKTIEPPPQTPSQSMPPIESLLPPKPPEPPNEFMQSDLKVLHTNKRYGRPSKVRFRTRLHRNLCFHSTMTIAGERHQQEMQARKKSSTCVESRLETRGHLMQNNATRDRGKEIAGDGSSFQDYGKPCIIWEELVVYVHSGFQEARHENRTTPSNSLNPNWLIQWNETYLHYHKVDPKQTYYLSMEYLQGRALTNAIGNLNVQDAYADALNKLGHELEEIVEQEKDAALGNGGLGRLASCFLDSMATLNLPAWGYGLRYRYGLFKQRIAKEGQEEIAEDWLEKFSPWEVVRHDVVFPVRFFGQVEINTSGSREWVGGEVVQALAYDVPIPGYNTKNTNSLRLWDAKAGANDFNLFQFNDGQYESAAQLHSKAQQICAVLYPGDATENGKLLRLKQQFFLCSASLQDIIFRFKERKYGKDARKWSEFPNKVAVQLNDTHPTLAIPELMRLLMDEEGLGWDEAWDVTTRTIAYTNHTVLPEALEKWSQAVMWKLLPRHMEIIQEIDKRFIAMIRSTRSDLESKISSMCILDNNPQKPVVRMANLCVVSAHTVNGVAQLHSDILKAELFSDYVSVWPTKLQNKTNGITPRRWLRFCSPELSSIITKWLKTDQWVTNLDLLTDLRQFADNEELHEEWASAKMANKQRLAQYILRVTGVTIDPNSLFDIQVKRIHEYKRQLLNILGTIYRYKKLKEMSPEDRKYTTPRTIMIGGKAFATYTNAKRIVKLVNDVGAVVNNDPDVNNYLKVVFVPNYNVSVAEVLIPGSELSQHISTAGMEASGTSNMKFALNGCLIIGTLDGANVEIREEVGEENFFLCGATADEVPRLRKEREDGLFKPDPRFEEAKQFIRSGAFGSYDYNPLLDSLEGNSGYGRGDYFLVGYDFPSYMDAQERVDEAYKDRRRWLKMSILSTAGSGKFSSDRTIAQYAKEIWNIQECRVP